MKGGIKLEDIKLFQKLMQTRENKLYRIAYSYMKNKEDSLDCVQDAVLKALENFHKLENKDYFDTWMVRILINICKDSLRKKQNISTYNDNLGELYEDNNSIEVIDLISSLNKLDDKERELIYLRYFEDKKIHEISKEIQVKEGTVKSRLHRILGKLKLNLE